MDGVIDESCQQTTKDLLKLAQTFARKCQRPANQLTCTDLINALDCMNILYKQRFVDDRFFK